MALMCCGNSVVIIRVVYWCSKLGVALCPPATTLLVWFDCLCCDIKDSRLMVIVCRVTPLYVPI
jgi:hypothetical protein